MAFVKVKRMFKPLDPLDKSDDTVIINTDKIEYILKIPGNEYVGDSYAVYYETEDKIGNRPASFDRENAEKIFKAIGVSLD